MSRPPPPPAPLRCAAPTADDANLRSVDTITFEKTTRGIRLTYDANLTLKGIRYAGDFALHLAFHWIGRRALEGLRAALSIVT